MKWTVALQKTDNINPKRLQAGDIVAFKPIKDESLWSTGERASFDIIALEVTKPEMSVLCETLWDITDYEYPAIGEKVYKRLELYPCSFLKKRRFKIQDIKKSYTKLNCYDKMHQRYILEADKLEPLKPILIKPTETYLG